MSLKSRLPFFNQNLTLRHNLTNYSILILPAVLAGASIGYWAIPNGDLGDDLQAPESHRDSPLESEELETNQQAARVLTVSV